MKLKFVNGTTKLCRPPVEQKLFKEGRPNGWLLSVRISEQTESVELDELLAGGIETLTFQDDAGVTLFVLTGSVRYGESSEDYIAEIQFSKGV